MVRLEVGDVSIWSEEDANRVASSGLSEIDEKKVIVRKKFFGKRNPETIVYIGWALGLTFGVGLMLALTAAKGWLDFGLFMCCLSVYHMWEWTYVAFFHPRELTGDSFLINHSTEWVCAWAFCVIEYFAERLMFPSLKNNLFVVIPAFAVVVGGQAIRTVSMYTAGSNFAHEIEESARQDHELVTTGIYAFSRHPSYFGWFWWTIAMQALLCNPISIAAFAFVAWKFFEDRIPYEETYLIEMFGDKYRDYKKRVPTRIPFIN